MLSIDILIKDVRAMELPTYFAGVQFSREDPGFLKPFKSRPLDLMEPGLQIYGLRSGGWEGYVVGGDFTVIEGGPDRPNSALF